MSEVTQEDREAAARISEWTAGRNQHADDIRSGKEDLDMRVQAFAAHREAAIKAERRAIAGYLREFGNHGTDGYENCERCQTAEAILQGHHLTKAGEE